MNSPGHMVRATTAILLVATGAQAFGQAAALPAGYGQRMTVDGIVMAWATPAGKAADGTVVPVDCRVEVGGRVLVAKADLPAGEYTVEIKASENSFDEAGRRIFTAKMASGNGEVLAKDVDLYALAGGAGKPYLIRATVQHPGGPFKVALTASLDNAKVSVIRVLDAKGAKVAWLLAEDMVANAHQPGTPPEIAGPVVWTDAGQPVERRVADLIRRMTLREKVRQLSYQAPAIERLGLPAYNYWSECLHGVARNGPATVFPQAIGMAATWDPALIHEVGDTISTEARAKFLWSQQHRKAPDTDGSAGRFAGLTFWSPNINIFRDPRWGRGQETYGEDPYLTSQMAVAFIQGLQGSDPNHLKVVATAKHFAVHSGPESLRHEFDVAPPERDFHETYLPQFESAVREGHVYSVMGAYNSVYGEPACASDLLLKTLLRHDWGFDGYIVSDCGAISDIWAYHRVADNQAEAAARAVLAGCDLECGGDYAALSAAVDLNLIGEGAIDAALTRVVTSRFKLGLFDPPAASPYARITAADYDTPAHGMVALKMARESMVLLKNDGVLPLRKDVRKLAVIGPNADGLLPLLGNYNGAPTAPVTVIDGIRGVLRGPTQVTFIRGCESAALVSPWQVLPDVCLQAAGSPAGVPQTGLRGEYFDNANLAGQPKAVRIDKVIDVGGAVEYLIGGVPRMPMSARWTGQFVAPEDGDYQIALAGRPGYRFWIGDTLIVDTWKGDTMNAGRAGLRLRAGQAVPLKIECWEIDGFLSLHLLWNRGDIDLASLVAERVKDAEAIVFVGGLDGHMEAEEGDSRGEFEGFTGGDRDVIELPATQSKMLRALVGTGKPVVFVNLSGSAMAMPWEAEHVNAIMQGWYPGQAGGAAVAEVLFGDTNPAGRLPVTFYKATSDLPAFTDYAMKDRTYRYFTGHAQWPFGFGLSYTQFRYSNLQCPAGAGATDTVTVSLDVTNTGSRDGDEVVQIYARPAAPAEGDAIKRLVGFKRVAVAAGRTVHVESAVLMAAMRNWDVTKKAYVVPPGRYVVEVGASSADVRATRQMVVR